MLQNLNSVAHVEDLIPLIKESLDAGHSVRFFPRGTSMLPMLRQDIDSVVLSPVSEKLKKYDIAFYQRDNGKYVLHRIIKAGDTYTCMGDNQMVPESGLRHDQMIAVVTAFYRGDKYIPVNSITYRLYCRIWLGSLPIRKFAKRIINRLRRILRRSKK
jgi:signal peptidase I